MEADSESYRIGDGGDRMKHLWKGLFPYRCELEKEYAYAYSKEQARVIMLRRLAKRHGVHPSTVLSMFPAGGGNHAIELELEITEDT